MTQDKGLHANEEAKEDDKANEDEGDIRKSAGIGSGGPSFPRCSFAGFNFEQLRGFEDEAKSFADARLYRREIAS